MSTKTETETAPDQISQADLELYRDKANQLKDLDWAVGNLRKSLMGRIDRGVSVEPGPLDAAIVETEQRRITNEALIANLGIEVVENLRAVIAPSKSRSLKILERTVKPAAARSRRRKVA